MHACVCVHPELAWRPRALRFLHQHQELHSEGGTNCMDSFSHVLTFLWYQWYHTPSCLAMGGSHEITLNWSLAAAGVWNYCQCCSVRVSSRYLEFGIVPECCPPCQMLARLCARPRGRRQTWELSPTGYQCSQKANQARGRGRGALLATNSVTEIIRRQEEDEDQLSVRVLPATYALWQVCVHAS